MLIKGFVTTLSGLKKEMDTDCSSHGYDFCLACLAQQRLYRPMSARVTKGEKLSRRRWKESATIRKSLSAFRRTPPLDQNLPPMGLESGTMVCEPHRNKTLNTMCYPLGHGVPCSAVKSIYLALLDSTYMCLQVLFYRYKLAY